MNFSKKFVCEDVAYSTYAKNVPAPLFRKSFNLSKSPDSAEILICGLGFYDLFVNGNKITKGHLAPYISNSDHICYYDSYDLKKYLIVGENVIGVMLGDGHQVGKTSVWDFKDNVMNSAPLLALSAEIVCGDEKIAFEADDFVCKKGPIIFNDLRSGEFYDARLYEKDWDSPNFKEVGWHKPLCGVYTPRGEARICNAEPIKVYREIKPVSITKGEIYPFATDGQIDEFIKTFTPFENPVPASGGYIYDFGENNSGIIRLKIKGKKGQKIDLQCGEQLNEGKLCFNNAVFYPDGFVQRDIYYCNGEGEEIYEPSFTYHGFRYVYVYGITEEQATEDLLTYLVMSSSLEKRGDFECSNEMANTIYQMGRRSDISNFFYFPTDCPHREKNGWTGDASVSAEHMILTIGAENSWKEWLHNVCAAQKSNGQLPGIVPTGSWGYEWGNGPAWDAVIFNLPYFAYKYRGETEIIKENATAMLRYLEYVSKRRNEKGIVAIGLGDWCQVIRKDGVPFSEAELGFTDSVMVLDMCRKGAEMFDVIGLPFHKAFAENLGKEMLQAIRKEYIDFSTYTVKGEFQTTQAMAIFYDVFTESEKQSAFNVLMDIIKRDKYGITSGLLGLRVIFHVLEDFGQADLAYKMITKKEFPSYGYWVSKGATTFYERFEEYDDYFHISCNHHFLGDVVGWFMSCCGGIKVQNSNTVIVKPSFVKELTWCKASHTLPCGKIEVYWERKGDVIELKVTADKNVNYTVELSTKEKVKVI